MAPVSQSKSELLEPYFSLFELKPAFQIDLIALEKKYYQIAKTLHPDRFAAQTDQDKKTRALEKMSELNQAYQTLKTPDARREYLLKAFEIPTPKAKIPTALAEEWFDVQDEPNSPAFKEFGIKLQQMNDDLHSQVTKLEKHFDQTGATSALVSLAQLIQDISYIESLGRDIKKYELA